MSDFISRQVAIEKSEMLFKELKKDTVDMMGIGYNHAVADSIAILKNLPSAQEWKTGEWIHCDDGSVSYRCSVCGRHAYGSYSEIFSGEYHYCPFCGAKMKGEDDVEAD